MKKVNLIICGLLVVILCCVSFYIGGKSNFEEKKEEVSKNEEKLYHLEFGDSFSELDLSSYSGKSQKLPCTRERYQLVFYLDTRCSTCMNQLVAVKHLENIFKGEVVDIKIVWSGDYKVENIEKLGLTKEHNFYLKTAKIDSATPTCYILDSDNKIIFITSEVGKALEKILQSADINRDVIVDKCNKYFLELGQEDKPLMVSFLMDGCKDCEEAEPIIKGNTIQKKYSIFDVYTEDSYGSKEIVDVGNVFLTIYGLDWYPSFLVINKDEYKIIGNTPIDRLEDVILNAI